MPSVLKPWRARPVGDESNTVAVVEELGQPRSQRVSSAEWRVHPDEAVPVLFQRVRDKEPASRNECPTCDRRSDIHIEIASQRIEDVLWRVPFIGFTSGFPERHDGRLGEYPSLDPNAGLHVFAGEFMQTEASGLQTGLSKMANLGEEARPSLFVCRSCVVVEAPSS